MSIQSQPIRVSGSVEGVPLDGLWVVTAVNIETPQIEVSSFAGNRQFMPGVGEVTAEIVLLEQATQDQIAARHEAERQQILDRSPADVREALAALYELEATCPPGQQAIVEVCQDRKDGRRFIAQLRSLT